MAWTTPKTWATNDSLGASTLNTHIRDNENFLYGAPRCRVYNSAAVSIANAGSGTVITFDSERYDNDTMHSTSTNTGRITFTTAGYYMVGGHVNYATNATGIRQAQIRANGATLIAIQENPAAAELISVVTCSFFAAGEYVELLGYQTSGGALNVEASAAYSPEFWAHWQGG